ncbi:dehydratase family protein, partial [Vibrio parahaemolyticus V-223/04]
ARLVWCATVI